MRSRLHRIDRAKRFAALLALAPLAACNALLDLGAPPMPIGDASDAGSDADASAAPYYRFDDDFETGDFRRWTKQGHDPQIPGAIEVVTSGAYAGCCALHAVSDGGGVSFQYEILNWTQASPKVDPVTSGTIAVRARIKASQLDRDTRELSFDEHDTSPTAFASAGFGATDPGPGFHWGFILQDPSTANDAQSSASDVADALGGWHCVEYIITVATAGHLAIFMDDQPVPLIEGDADTTVAIGWDSLTAGLGFTSGATGASEVLLDDVAIALYHDQRHGIHLGCH